MAATQVAIVYAQALLELSDERGKRAAVVASCRLLAEAMTSEAIALLDDPRLGKHKAKDALASLLKDSVEAEVLDLLRLLVDRNRLRDAPGIMAEVIVRAESAAGVHRAQLCTAVPLPAAVLERETAALRRILGAGLSVQASVVPELIGGMTLRIGDLLVDGSVSRQLTQVRDRMRAIPISNNLWAD